MLLEKHQPSNQRRSTLRKLLERYVLDAFGMTLKLEATKPPGLPHLILDRYILWTGRLANYDLLFMAPKQDTANTLDGLIRHRDAVRRAQPATPTLLVLEKMSAQLRRRLIEKKVAFVTPGFQFYLPDLLIYLRETYRADRRRISESLSPTAQVLVLGELLGHGNNELSATRLAEKYRVTPMSMSRALDELEAAELVKTRRSGTQRLLEYEHRGLPLWNAAQERLASPIRKSRFVKARTGPRGSLHAGLSALSALTDIAAPKTPCVAISSVDWKDISADGGFPPSQPYDAFRLEVQTWRYDPRVLTHREHVDHLSLYLSLRDEPDERVAAAADELLDNWQW
jgi:DNA-binding MarR family transcriptional regulator